MAEHTEEDVTNLKDAFFECPVCFGAFNQTDRRPRLLYECLHAICTGCLDKLIQKEGGGRLTCPICRHVAKVKGKATSFPADPVRSKLLDFIKMKKEKKALCSDCPDGHEADSWCQKCSLFLCKECKYVHKRHKMTSNHSILDLEQVLEQSLKQLSAPHFCTKHPESKLEFFCSTDESFCCASCIMLNHQGHKFAKTEEALKPQQQDLDTRLQQTKNHALSLQDQRNRVETNKVAIVQNGMEIKSEVQKEFSKLVRMIQIKKESLLEEIDQHCNEKVGVCDKNIQEIDENLAMIESTQTYISQANKHLDALDMLQLLPALKHSLVGLSNYRSSAAEQTPPCGLSTAEKSIPLFGRLEVRSGTDKPSGALEYKELALHCLSMYLESKDTELVLKEFSEKEKINKDLDSDGTEEEEKHNTDFNSKVGKEEDKPKTDYCSKMKKGEGKPNTHFNCMETNQECTITITECGSKETGEGGYKEEDGATQNTDHSAREAKMENKQNSGYGCRWEMEDATTDIELGSREIFEEENNNTDLDSKGKEEEEISEGDFKDSRVGKKEEKPKTDYGSKLKRGEGKPNTHLDCTENKKECTITNKDCNSKEKGKGGYKEEDGATPNTDHSVREANEENKQNSGYGCRWEMEDATTDIELGSREIFEEENNNTDLDSKGKEREETSEGDFKDSRVGKKEEKPKTDYGSKLKRGEGKPNTHLDCTENKKECTITNKDCNSKEKGKGGYKEEDGATPNTDHSVREANEENKQNSGYGCRWKTEDATTDIELGSREIFEEENNNTDLDSEGNEEEETLDGDFRDSRVGKKERKPKTDNGSKLKRGEGKPNKGFVYLKKEMRQDLINTNIIHEGRDVQQTGIKSNPCFGLEEEVKESNLGLTQTRLKQTPDLSSTEEFQEEVQDRGKRGQKPKALTYVRGKYGGRMTSRFVYECCEGYENSSTIEIRYQIPADTITKRYIGVDYIAYLPDNKKGQKLLLLLEVAWRRGLTFLLDKDKRKFKLQIMHKQFLTRSWDRSSSYPDSTYLKRLQGKLHELGVTKDDI